MVKARQTNSGARMATLAGFVLMLGLGACENPPDIDLSALTGNGGATGSGGATGGAGSATPNATTSATMPGTVNPNEPAGAGCKMYETEKEVCVTCIDAGGKVVKEGCYTKDDKPAGTTCEDVRRADGTLCTICFDGKGTVIKSSCRATEPPCPPGGTPPKPMITCRDYVEMGTHCSVCYDVDGKEIRRSCAGSAGSGGANGGSGGAGGGMPVMCKEEKYPDGTVCSYCTDARGQVVSKGCSGQMPAPTEPADVKCAEYDEKGARCIICTGPKGEVVKQGCWQPAPPMMPTPPDQIKCTDTKYADGTVCTTCRDPKGNIVKEGCSMPQSGPQ